MEPQQKLKSLEIFERLAAAVDRACDEEHFYIATKAAEELGLEGGAEAGGGGWGERFEFHHEGADGRVTLKCRWYDQSKAFSVQPDRHVFSLSLEDPAGETLTHSREYER